MNKVHSDSQSFLDKDADDLQLVLGSSCCSHIRLLHRVKSSQEKSFSIPEDSREPTHPMWPPLPPFKQILHEQGTAGESWGEPGPNLGQRGWQDPGPGWGGQVEWGSRWITLLSPWLPGSSPHKCGGQAHPRKWQLWFQANRFPLPTPISKGEIRGDPGGLGETERSPCRTTLLMKVFPNM